MRLASGTGEEYSVGEDVRDAMCRGAASLFEGKVFVGQATPPGLRKKTHFQSILKDLLADLAYFQEKDPKKWVHPVLYGMTVAETTSKKDSKK